MADQDSGVRPHNGKRAHKSAVFQHGQRSDEGPDYEDGTGPEHRRKSEAVPAEADKKYADICDCGCDDPSEIKIEACVDRKVVEPGSVLVFDFLADDCKREEQGDYHNNGQPDYVKVPCEDPADVHETADGEPQPDCVKFVFRCFLGAEEAPLTQEKQSHHHVDYAPDREGDRRGGEKIGVFFGYGTRVSDAEGKNVGKRIDNYHNTEGYGVDNS